MISERNKRAILHDLTETLETFVARISEGPEGIDSSELGAFGHNIAANMATAAMAVLECQCDTNDYRDENAD